MKDDNAKTRRPRERLYDDNLPAPIDKKRPAWRSTIEDSGPTLSALEESFVQFWTRSYKLPLAAIEAGYPPARAMIVGRQLLQDDRIQRRIASIEQARLMRIQINPDEWFRRLMFQASAIAFADLPYDLIVPPCRYCWGEQNLYQRTYAELERDLELYNQGYIIYPDGTSKRARKGEIRSPFDKLGGPGYDIYEGANENCPECKGHGLAAKPILVWKDTRFMSPEQRMLLASARSNGRGGVEIQQHDRQQARQLIIDVLMRYKDYSDLPATGDGAGFANMSLDQLKQLVATGEELGLDDEEEDEE